MSFINMPDILANEYNFTPLPKTWYHEEVDTVITRTYRFAKRTDHTGILIKVDTDLFYQTHD